MSEFSLILSGSFFFFFLIIGILRLMRVRTFRYRENGTGVQRNRW